MVSVWWLVTLGVACVIATAFSLVVKMLRVLQSAVGLEPPTETQRAEETLGNCALFRALPALQHRLAWRELGVYPTPVHRGTVRPAGKSLGFYVKREDLASPRYGGNKVRTLQHQLAVIEARLERSESSQHSEVLVMGSTGSNQVPATLVHASSIPSLPPLTVGWMSPDEPCLDNTLNLLSTLSLPAREYCMPGQGFALEAKAGGGGAASTGARAALRAALRGGLTVFMGGNCPAGVLGQVSGALELAEQIERGDCPDIDRLYVAMGSSCTVSGIILGVTLARHLRMKAFRSPTFRIVGVPIHHVFIKLQARFDFHRNWSFLPLTVAHTLRVSCRALVEIGGPDLQEEALALLADRSAVEFSEDAELCGKYGAHSARSLAAAQAYDETGTLSAGGKAGGKAAGGKAAGAKAAQGSAEEEPLWLCGHFASKPFARMVDDLASSKEGGGPVCLFWATKSVVQPRGPRNEWDAIRSVGPKGREWVEKGKAASARRPASVDLDKGSARDYRHLMTSVSGVVPQSTSTGGRRRRASRSPARRREMM